MKKNQYFSDVEKFKILLLTHITSDNIGDQFIELCSNSLIKTCLKNLGVNEDSYEILSLDADLFSNQFLSMQKPNQKDDAEDIIKESDLIIFGGAPMFNYTYEGFGERTARTLDIISKYKKSVIFSAIGVEGFDLDNLTCRHLKEALNSDSVMMVTTRDNIDALEMFMEGKDAVIAKVSDPAVFSSIIMDNLVNVDNKNNKKKKIGVFVIRGKAFIDNRISFNQDQATQMWLDLALRLEKSGYDYEFLTSGSHNDEAYLDKLVLEYGLDKKHCVSSLVTPEELAERISSYDGIISCRLHPSIIAYSYKIPTVGLVWNDKVTSFYQNIGYPERVLSVEGIKVKKIIDSLEKAMKKGVSYDKEFLMSSYNYLFDALKKIITPKSKKKPYKYDELIKNIYRYEGSDFNNKLEWKVSRVYSTFNSILNTSQKRLKDLNNLTEEYNRISLRYEILNERLKRLFLNVNNSIALFGLEDDRILLESQKYDIYYNIGKKEKSLIDNVRDDFNEDVGQIFVRPNSIELVLNDNEITNDGSAVFIDNVFKINGFNFIGWKLRINTYNNCYIVLNNGKFIEKNNYIFKKHGSVKVYKIGDNLPVIPFENVMNVVCEGVWEEDSNKEHQ